VAQTVSTMIASSGVNDSYKMYVETQRDGVDFNSAYTGDDFDVPYTGPFDPKYMRQLFSHGYRAGFPWAKAPPNYTQ
jgi:hypothetical protein